MNNAVATPVFRGKLAGTYLPWIATLVLVVVGIPASSYLSGLKQGIVENIAVKEWIHNNDAVLTALENAAYNANYLEAETAINKFESQLRALPFASDDAPTQNLIARCERAKAILKNQISIVEDQSNTRYQPGAK